MGPQLATPPRSGFVQLGAPTDRVPLCGPRRVSLDVRHQVMGEVTERRANGAHCGAEVPVEHSGLCPSCGKEGKLVNLTLQDTVSVHSSLSWETRKEYYQRHKGALAVVVSIAILSPFLGFVLVGPLGIVGGLGLGGLSYYLGPKAITKVIEKTRGRA